jgi:hypothetical protein
MSRQAHVVAREAMHSSSEMNWRTPPFFLDLVRQVGLIGYDPATASDNPTDALSFSTPEGTHDNCVLGWLEGEDGLRSDWAQWHIKGALTFCNPPYGRALQDDWAPKMAVHRKEAIYLVPARVETQWWESLLRTSTRTLLWSSPEFGSRVHFVNPDGTPAKNGAAFPSSVFYRGPRFAKFARVFGRHGKLIREVRA